MTAQFEPQRQRGSSIYIVLSLLVLIAIGVVIFLLTQQDQAEVATLPEQDQPVLNAEPPAIKPVDMQQAEIDSSLVNRPTAVSSSDKGTAEADLFSRRGRKIPLEDGLAGGSEAEMGSNATTSSAAARSRVHALDAFDYGVLDGRVRIGVFGKGPIPDYRVKLTSSYYVIDMPGEFRYIDDFSRALVIERFGVARAQLSRSPRGIQLRIDVTKALKHQPFLIEDAKGLMVAFELQP